MSTHDNDFLTAPYQVGEIISALKCMGPIKALGGDGFLALFFKKFWHIVSFDVISFCLGILNEGKEIDSINGTKIVLVLKIPNPTGMVNFCPISLYTVLYNIITKTIANRLQGIIRKYINDA